MARGIHTLTRSDCLAHIKKCRRLKIIRSKCDGGGLYLRATATEAASWLFRFEQEGRGREHGLGSFYTFDLDEARERARACRQLIAEGKDPIAEKQAARAAVRALRPQTASRSFKFCVTKYIAFKEASWRSDKHRQDWESSLENHAYPVFDKGNQLVSTITLEDVLAVLQPKWGEYTETMRRVRQRIETVLDWAKGQKLRSGENPARWAGGLDAYLNLDVRKPTKHFAALTYPDIPAFVAELQTPQGDAEQPDTASDALQVAILTAARSREIRLATWNEFDLTTGVWEIPGTRMKAKKPHRVPLTETVIALLRRQPTFPQPGMPRTGFVFCNAHGVQALGELAMRRRLQKLRPGMSVHGSVRSSFSTWAADVARVGVEIREVQLAHAGDKVVQAYMRSDFLAERRELMARWEHFCLTPFSDNVTPLRVAV